MIKVSVIVPVYNKAQYLRECLDSLISQTLKDIEIICIDDKSTDDSLDILSEYLLKDKRINVIAQDINRGVSVARNTGIKLAQGEFIAFVDADDFVDRDFYERLYGASNGYDCVKGEIWNYDTDINRCILNDIYNLNDKIKATKNPIYFYYGFTSAIYRKEYVDRYGFHFPEGISYYEDPFFTITLTSKLLDIKVVDGAKYYYRNVNTSLSHDISNKKIDDFCSSMSAILTYLKQCDNFSEKKYIVVNQFLLMMSEFIKDGKIDGDRLHKIEKEFISFLGLTNANGAPKVSIIVPVYNGEKYLRRTLNCLMLQSLHDIEIICVNDKSVDRSIDILNEYQKIDNRIKVIDCTENGGESKARNIGIYSAIGEYIAFVDQDDMLDLLFYEKLYEKAKKTSADIIKGDVKEYYYDGQEFVKRNFPVEKQPLYFTGDWWSAIYKRTLVYDNHVELPEGYPLGGDLKFLFDVCSACKKLIVAHGVFYYHLMHSDSGDSEKTSYNKIKSVLSVFAYMLNKIEQNNLYENDIDCYVFYYYSYIEHAYLRIQKCPEIESKRACIDFIFQYYDVCRSKEEVLKKLQVPSPLLANVLKNHKKDFFVQLIEQDALSSAFFERDPVNENKIASIACTLVVPYIQKELVKKYIIDNVFLKKEKNISFYLIDNRNGNKPISVVYNEFLNSYDYNNESWFIFMHSDFEFLAFPSEILKNLDPSNIYGPIGAKVCHDKQKMYIIGKGDVIEKAPDKTMYYYTVYKWHDMSVDTLDCQCIIIHSSLIKKYDLRFDPKTIFDLYVEDFCIQAKKNHGIHIFALYFDCAHHSGYAKEKNYSNRYLEQLKYINQKYPDEVYGGTVTSVGGKILPLMNNREFHMYVIRQELLTGKKL